MTIWLCGSFRPKREHDWLTAIHWTDPALINRPPFAFPLAVVVFGLTMMVSRTLGFLLFGFATMRSNVLLRWAGLLLIIGVLLAFGSGVSPLIGSVAAAIFGLGLAWLGYAFWLDKGMVEAQHL